MKIKLEFQTEEERTQVLTALNGVRSPESLDSQQLELVNSQVEDQILNRMVASVRSFYISGRARNATEAVNPRDLVQEANNLIQYEAVVLPPS